MMTFSNFNKLLKDTYPVLYSYDVKIQDCLIGGLCVTDFIDLHKIKPSTKSYISYNDVWDYIVKNELRHTWWLL